LTAPLPEVREWLAEAPMTAEHIAQRLRVVRINYFVTDMTEAESKAWLLSWVKALRGIPARFIAEAFDDWFAEETRRPSFADIGNHARKNMADAHRRIREDTPREPEPEPEPLTDAEIERRQEIMAEYGFGPSGVTPRLKVVPKGLD
jgi:hypothetical protein